MAAVAMNSDLAKTARQQLGVANAFAAVAFVATVTIAAAAAATAKSMTGMRATLQMQVPSRKA